MRLTRRLRRNFRKFSINPRYDAYETILPDIEDVNLYKEEQVFSDEYGY